MKTYFISVSLLVCLCSASAFQDDALLKSKARGKELYTELCIACHLAEGQGVKGSIPPLAKADYLNAPEKAIHAIKFGLSGKIVVNGVTYDNVMPEQGLSDEEIADLTNYILNSWGNKGKYVSPAMVAKVKE